MAARLSQMLGVQWFAFRLGRIPALIRIAFRDSFDCDPVFPAQFCGDTYLTT